MWNATVSLPGGRSVRITGHDWVSGQLDIAFSGGIGRTTVARAYDYVYPHDVRIDAGTSTLFVAMDGLAAGILPEARLFEYDLAHRRPLGEFSVEPGALPPACPVR